MLRSLEVDIANRQKTIQRWESDMGLTATELEHREIRRRGDTTIPKGNINQGTKLERTITKFLSNGK